MNCCNCDRPVELGPQHVQEPREDLAVRCAYCLRMFCVPCSKGHFEPEWVEDAITSIQERVRPARASVDVQTGKTPKGRKTRIVIEVEEEQHYGPPPSLPET